MSQQGISKDVLNAVSKATGNQLSEQAVKAIASGINQKKKIFECPNRFNNTCSHAILRKGTTYFLRRTSRSM
jgi:hypothetical protein